MKIVFITGAYGQLGETCINYLKSYFNINSAGRHSSDDGIQLDITDSKITEKLVVDIRPDVILNLAAMTNVDGCETDPEMAEAINVDGVKNLSKSFDGHFIPVSYTHLTLPTILLV